MQMFSKLTYHYSCRKELATLLNHKLAMYKEEQNNAERVAELPAIQTIRLPFLTFAIGTENADMSSQESVTNNNNNSNFTT